MGGVGQQWQVAPLVSPLRTINRLLDSIFEDVLLSGVHGEAAIKGETGCLGPACGPSLELDGCVISIVKVYNDVASLPKLQCIGRTKSGREDT